VSVIHPLYDGGEKGFIGGSESQFFWNERRLWLKTGKEGFIFIRSSQRTEIMGEAQEYYSRMQRMSTPCVCPNIKYWVNLLKDNRPFTGSIDEVLKVLFRFDQVQHFHLLFSPVLALVNGTGSSQTYQSFYHDHQSGLERFLIQKGLI
jgi:hypothetical protein